MQTYVKLTWNLIYVKNNTIIIANKRVILRLSKDIMIEKKVEDYLKITYI